MDEIWCFTINPSEIVIGSNSSEMFYFKKDPSEIPHFKDDTTQMYILFYWRPSEIPMDMIIFTPTDPSEKTPRKRPLA